MSKLNAEQRKLLKRLDELRAKAFPTHTTPACRHAHMIGEYLLKGRKYTMLSDEPQHCAESILHTIAMLWESKLSPELVKADCDDLRTAALVLENPEMGPDAQKIAATLRRLAGSPLGVKEAPHG